jgi:transposase, IS6 family
MMWTGFRHPQVIAGHAFVQNVRRGHYELAVEEPTNRRLAVAFHEFGLAL